jgi:hypothetical protein
MAAEGEVTPMPDHAIFADTGDEPAEVYGWLDWLERRLPFPVIRTRRDNQQTLGEFSLNLVHSKRTPGKICMQALVPAFVIQANKRVGLLGRRCTGDYKIDPIHREIRRLLGVKSFRGKQVQCVQWMGISRDEMGRMKTSMKPSIEFRYPLIEKRMSRQDCLHWMEARAYPTPPRSACRYCPFHNDNEWVRLRDQMPEEFELAAKFEDDLNRVLKQQNSLQADAIRLHSSGLPLRECTFPKAAEHREDQMDLFGFQQECEGMCGI